jgi:maltose/moltooligosaccharide transporter
MENQRPRLSMLRILEMNLGFLGLQFSFGLQQANPIFAYLGAKESDFPWLGVAGPLTGLIVQPIIGVMSDRTLSKWGRRTPYFLVGALMCSAGLLLMPFSQSLLMAFSILFLLDVGNNVTMEPYRAYVNDRLRSDQRGFGFLSQSGFTGLAQCLAYLSPFVLVNVFGVSKVAAPGVIPDYTRLAFFIGAAMSLTTILWSMIRVPELPLGIVDRARIEALPRGAAPFFGEIFGAIRDMPQAMRTMAWMSLFQWYAMCCYWAYRVPSISMALFGTSDGSTQHFREADLLAGPMGAFYNAIAFVAAFSMAPLARRFGAGRLHAISLTLNGLALLAMPLLNSQPPMWAMMGLMGLGWGSIMGNPYIILANAIPAERTGVYMGIFNMMICAPMLVFAATMPFLYQPVLGGDPRNALAFGGVLMLCAAVAVSRVKTGDGAEPAAAVAA